MHRPLPLSLGSLLKKESCYGRLRLCIVTADLLGAVRNGGIGTANYYLASELVKAGHSLKVLLTLQSVAGSETFDQGWTEPYRQLGIDVVIAEVWARCKYLFNTFPDHPSLRIAKNVYDWLSTQEFDLVILMDWQGHGFYALSAKQAGLSFQNTTFIVQTHSPSLWHTMNNAAIPPHPVQAIGYFIERRSIEMADAVISPSVYMLNWAKQHGFALPNFAFVQPNLINAPEQTDADVAARAAVDEIVFFGRLEYRKGLLQFCDAIDRLVAQGATPRQVTFLGKFSKVGTEHAGLYISRRAIAWPFQVRILARYGQAEALRYLAGNGRVAIIPSVADNSPYTVYECLVAGVPFLSRNVGGIAELIHPDDHAACLFNDNPNMLARSLARILEEGAPKPRLAFDLEENRRAWREGLSHLHQQVMKARQPDAAAVTLPLVSVCLTHYARPQLLRQAVVSLMEQDYPKFEVILVDDGSPDEETSDLLQSWEGEFARRDWSIVRLDNGYLGRARNAAARVARGEYLLFMDDDNVARPFMISRFVRAALSSEADLVTSVFDVFTGTEPPDSQTKPVERYLPVGGILSFSVVGNAVGDANALMRRSTFERLGGFSEDYGLGHEDFELFLRAVLAGAKTAVVPESLFWYRRNSASMLSVTHAEANRLRSLRPFLEGLPAPLAELAVLAHGVAAASCFPPEPSVLALDNAAHLSAEELRRLDHTDPDAPSAVAIVCKALMLSNQDRIAAGILADICHDENLAVESAERIAAIEALMMLHTRAGDTDALQRILDDQLDLGLSKQSVARLYGLATPTLFENPETHTVGIAMARRQLELDPDDISGRLVFSQYLLNDGAIAEALPILDEALVLADREYLRLRPDIGRAVAQQQFACGMDHFAHHGRLENAPWPEAALFRKAVEQLCRAIQSGERPAITLLPEAAQRIRFALEAFARPTEAQ
ncbi:glycosyltransferase [Azospirillum picis]|uniref:GT2 family glycosyltransferase/glycosyltransferase involved in cell wall biosynthesis n=1 Tax=Azospirillum picis TaxID=488438 RepID=A0ABU0MVA4_9PROT|nr:glycosyltransferase [Azospirillum picis]MBP2300897.1 GT2 family glycosyltransferase/glycosyltransferase involved in cell wall biosynthesis [Azospirillum picis]MDQ0537001.1 GT2 family glycosyltransferase/glycosyltransferase involved in cell wall biosynthesis [Azospirillum picis]